MADNSQRKGTTPAETKAKSITGAGTSAESQDVLSPALDFDSLLDCLPQGIRIIGKDQVIQGINTSFSDLTGIRSEDAVGKKCWEVFPSPFCQTEECRLNRILQGEQMVQSEIMRKKRDGTIVPCVVTAFPLRSKRGEVLGVMESFRDITEQKELQARAEETEDRYRALIELGTEAGEAIVMLQDVNGREGVHIFVSDQWPVFTGYTRAELLGMSFFDLLTDEDKQTALERHRTKMAGLPLPGLFELRIKHRNGHLVPIEITGAYTHFNGKRANVIYIRDLSQRKALEAALTDEMEKYRSLFDDAPITLWEMDYSEVKKYYDELKETGVTDFHSHFLRHPEDFIKAVRLHKMIRFNRAHIDLFEAHDYNYGDSLAQRQKDIFYKYPENFIALRDDYARFGNGETTFAKEETIRTMKENIKYILTRFTIAPGHEATWDRVFASLTDITERKLAEINLANSEERFRTLFEKAPVAILELDYTNVGLRFEELRNSGVSDFETYFDDNPGAVAYCFSLRKLVNANDEAFNLFEVSKLSEFQTTLTKLLDQKAESFPNFKRLITALANGKREFVFECQLTTLKGKQITLSFRYAVQPNNDNSLRRLFMTAFDLTSHNKAEEELRRYRNHLEELVKERTLELTRENTQRRMAESQLQKALKIEADLRKNSESQMAERILFTRALAHELKTPLTPLLAASEYLSTNLEGTPKEFAEAVSRGGRRLERRVNEFLDLSKGEIGLLELKHENVALDELLVALVADMKPAVQGRNQKLQLVTPGDLPVITGDHDRIEQVLLNLVNNAIKFNRQGGIITIKAGCMNNEIVISVQDEGTGIDVQNMQHLFEPYKRPSNQDTLGGLGLGLALSKMLVELHGGRIWVESSPKNGMLVSFSLPLSGRPKRGIEKL